MSELKYRVMVQNPASKRVIFFFCPFGIPRWQLMLPGLPLWKLKREGFQLVVYDYSLEIANTSPQRSVEYLEAILADVAQRVETYEAQGVSDMAAFGISLGTGLAISAAARHTTIEKLVLNLSYGSIAHHVLNVPFMLLVPPGRAARYVAAGGGPEGVIATFAPYEPLRLIPQLRHARILLFTARHDRLFTYPEVQKFRRGLQSAGIEVEYHENKYLGHLLGSLYNHFKHGIYVPFLASK